MSTLTDGFPASGRTGVERSRVWLGWRAALVAAWLVLAMTCVVAGERESTLGDLEPALRSGRVDQVAVSPGLGPRDVGYTVQTVRWRDRGLRRVAEVYAVSAGEPGPGLPEAEIVRQDVTRLLATWQPGVSVVQGEAPTSWSALWGFRMPPWAGWLTLLGALGSLVLLVSGPQPWRATRWAWFWLLGNPLGALAFLLLSGPTRFLPEPRPGSPRLTGGWAFLVALLLGALLTG